MYIIRNHRDENFLCCTNTAYPQRTAYWDNKFSNYVLLFESVDDALCYAKSMQDKRDFKGIKMDICKLIFKAEACVD